MPQKIKFIILIVLAVLLLLAASGFYVQYQNGRNHKAVKVSGNIEATKVRLAFRATGKIATLLVDEGYTVKAGALVARLDSDELTAVKNQAEANFNTAKFTYERAKGDYARIAALYRQHTVSAQDRDNAQVKLDTAVTTMDAVRAALELTTTHLGFANLTAALDGFVLTKSAEEGEVVQAGAPIFTVANLHDIWLTAYINETDLGRVKLNQNVDVKTDSYPNKTYHGTVSFIAEEAEFTPKQIQTTEERVKLVYRIKITVSNPNLELKPGMPADAFIAVNSNL